jgi:hypothetical protein
MLALVAAMFALGALALVGFVILTRPADLPSPTATAFVVTLPPAPVVSTFVPPTLTPTLAVALTQAPPPPAGGDVAVGAFVQVAGTGDAGVLNLRAEPSLASPINYVAIEREVLQVQAGPSEADGFVWWYLVDPATNTKFGWAVQNYLQVVQGP